jgi:hypothetical protein
MKDARRFKPVPEFTCPVDVGERCHFLNENGTLQQWIRGRAILEPVELRVHRGPHSKHLYHRCFLFDEQDCSDENPTGPIVKQTQKERGF